MCWGAAGLAGYRLVCQVQVMRGMFRFGSLGWLGLGAFGRGKLSFGQAVKVCPLWSGFGNVRYGRQGSLGQVRHVGMWCVVGG